MTEEDVVIVPTRPFPAPAFSIFFGVLAFSSSWILPGLLNVGVVMAGGGAAAVIAIGTGVWGTFRARRDPDKYGGPGLGMAGAALGLFWIVSGFKSGALGTVFTGKAFRDPEAEVTKQCEAGQVIGTCDQAGIFALDHAKDPARALTLLEKGCNGGGVYSCSIIASRLRATAPKDRIDAAIAQAKKLCRSGAGDAMNCAEFRAP